MSDSSAPVPSDSDHIDHALEQLTDRLRGMVYAMAIGDALAVSVQYRRPGSFMPVSDFLGGGPYDLPRGAFSDDTAVAYIFLDTLLEHQSFNRESFVQRLRRWADDGIGSASGVCAGISAATARVMRAPTQTEASGAGAYGVGERQARELLLKGWLLGVYFAFESEFIDEECQKLCDCFQCDSEVTQLVKAMALFAARWMQGEYPPALFETEPFVGYLQLGERIRSDGIEDDPRALWSVLKQIMTSSFSAKEQLLMIVNRGGDADIHATLAGAMIGARVGFKGLPQEWVSALMPQAMIQSMSFRLARGLLERLVRES
jgi:ADP-ribosylglycohydrolase